MVGRTYRIYANKRRHSQKKTSTGASKGRSTWPLAGPQKGKHKGFSQSTWPLAGTQKGKPKGFSKAFSKGFSKGLSKFSKASQK